MHRMAGGLSRFISAVRQQTSGVEPRLKIPLAVSNRLPTYAFGAVRLRLLRAARPGPDVVLGGVIALGVDAWRVRVALAAAATGQGGSELLDAVA